jgi:hypothetical protein
MEEENKMYWYVAKSRFSKNNVGFVVNVEYSYMRITDSNVSIQSVSNNKSKVSEKRKVEVNLSSHTQNISGGVEHEIKEWTKTINI